MRVILLAVLSVCFITAYGQIASVNDGAWELQATWDCGCVPSANVGPITVSHNVSINNDISLNTVTIANGGIVTIAGGQTVTIEDDFSGTPLLLIESGGQLINNGTLDISQVLFSGMQVDGVLESSSTIALMDPTYLQFSSGSIYRHNHLSGGDIPLATWDINSTCEISGLTNANPSPPNNLNQSFGNFTWNTPAMGQSVPPTLFHLGGNLTDVRGTLRFVTTNNRPVSFAGTGGAGFNLIIGDDFTIDNGGIILTQNQTSATTIAIGGDFVQTLGNFSFAASNSNSVSIEVAGNFSKSGNFLAGTGAGLKNIIFSGTGIQSFSGTPITSNANLHFIIENGAVLSLGTNALTTGTLGSFTLEAGASVEVGSISPSGAIQGNIPIVTRNFNAGSNVIYNGAGPQSMAVSIPAAVNTEIRNPAGVTLTTNVAIGGNLILTSGNLNVGSNLLTLGGNVTANGNSIVVVPGSSITVNGSGAFGTFPFPAGAQTLTSFTLNRSGGSVVFANDVTLTGALTFTDGNLDFSGRTLNVSGTFSSTGGLFASTSNASTLILSGAGAFGTLAFDPTANVLGTLTLNRNLGGAAALNSTLLVENALNLLAGEFTNTSGLSVGDGAVVTRTSNGQLLGSALANAPGHRYSVVYNGGVPYTTGLELPGTGSGDLLNLTINAPVTLDKAITVNGDLTLANSTLSSSNNITMAGNPGSWINQNGSFNPGTGTVIISGDITIVSPSATPQYANLTTTSTGTLTMPSGTVDILGNLQLHQSSTLNANGGTIEFNGTSSQVVSGGGRDFNNITVNKGGGDLQLTTGVRLNGLLDIASATTVVADGNLTVVSTSDGTSGNGSIGTLATGASITGNVTVQRFMGEEGRIYRYISSPVTGATVAQLQDDFPVTGVFSGASVGCDGCTTNPSLFYYDETTAGGLQDGYFQFPVADNTEVLAPGRGYAAFIRDNIIPGPVTIDVTGTVNQGTVVLPITHTVSSDPSADGYNLVGNPFPATINWNAAAGWSKSNIALPIAVRDNGGAGGFLYWDGVTGGLPNGDIATAQAFWVRSNPGGSLSVNENAKVTNTGEFFREKKITPDVFNLVLTDGAFTDRAYFRYRSEATGGKDDYDAPKLDNQLFDIATMSSDDIPMAINATNEMPCDNNIRVHVKDLQEGTYTLSTEAVGVFTGVKATLVDNFTNTTIDFTTTPQYSFSVTGDAMSSASDRFSVILDEVPIDPNLVTPQVGAMCEGETYEVTLEGTQRGIYYFAEIGGEAIGDSVLSDGQNPITLSVPATGLEVGANDLKIKAHNYCTTIPMTASLSIQHDLLYQATSNNVTDCEGAQVTLEASGAPDNGGYNWYEEENSVTPIEGQHTSIFVTPTLPKSKTYYVSAVNAKGCEGPRVEVKANVVPYTPVEITETVAGEFVSSHASGNQWYLDGEIIDGATGQTYKATQSGTYTVEVAFGGCVTSASADFLVTGVDEFSSSRLLTPHQNPFAEILTVRVASSKNVEQMSVFDNLGAKVGEMQLTRMGAVTEATIDMAHSASGMYVVKTLLEGRVYTIKVIKK